MICSCYWVKNKQSRGTGYFISRKFRPNCDVHNKSKIGVN